VRNFHKLSGGIAVGPLMATIARHGELWNQDRTRTGIPNSPHGSVDDILLRFGKPSLDDLGPFENKPSMALLEARAMVLGVMQLVGGSELGRVIITRLPPGAKIGAHADEGEYARRMVRHQVMVQSLPGNVFRCGDESISTETGELFWFNSSIEHEVINNSKDDRISLIIDCRI
jgi:uncharacterized RmlC-like cupin family protein